MPRTELCPFSWMTAHAVPKATVPTILTGAGAHTHERPRFLLETPTPSFPLYRRCRHRHSDGAAVGHDATNTTGERKHTNSSLSLPWQTPYLFAKASLSVLISCAASLSRSWAASYPCRMLLLLSSRLSSLLRPTTP